MIVDFCAYLGNWPLYPLPIRDAAGLVGAMDRCGIDAAFVSLVDGAFSLNPRDANERLKSLVAGHTGRLLPVGTVDPTSPCWREDVMDGVEGTGLAGFRIHPTYQGYALDNTSAPSEWRLPKSDGVLALAHTLAMVHRPLFIAAFIDEERFQHPAFRVPPVPLNQIAGLIRRAPKTTFVLNNLTVEQATALLDMPGISLSNVFMDVNAMDKPFNGLVQLIQHHGSDRLVYGSQVPFLYPEATLALLQEATDAGAEAILEQNWRTSETLRKLVENVALT